MKICSLLPSATEIICALGLEDQLVGISHVCDFPSSVTEGNAVVVTQRSSDLEGLSSIAIDEIIKSNRNNKIATQIVDAELLRHIEPDIIITQELCYVCAVEYGAVCDVTSGILSYEPNMISLKPAGLQDILDNILLIASACHVESAGNKLVESIKTRMKLVTDSLTRAKVPNFPNTFCIDWLEPLRNTGQWIPELIEIAGGNEGLAEKNGKSTEVQWEEVLNYNPDFIFSMPCAFPMSEVKNSTKSAFAKISQFDTLQAYQNERIYLFDGQVPSRHGPRFIDVLENFAEILHPQLFAGLPMVNLYTKFE